MLRKLPLVFTPQPEGGFNVTSPALPELLTEGDTLEEAYANVPDALAAVLELYREQGQPVPDSIELPPLGEVVPAEAVGRSPWRRLPTTVGLTALLIVAGIYVAMWIVAYRHGLAEVGHRHRFERHGPWRRDWTLNALFDVAAVVTVCGVLCAFLGGLLENSRRSLLAAMLGLGGTVLLFVHLMQFE